MSWTAQVHFACLIHFVGTRASNAVVCSFLYKKMLNPQHNLVMLCQTGGLDQVRRYLVHSQHASKPPAPKVNSVDIYSVRDVAQPVLEILSQGELGNTVIIEEVAKFD